ncbi:MAG: hypothetical protein IKI41_06240 [Clostridia bacterium]|nr:hypothetical protein [Clostridia bacterium]
MKKGLVSITFRKLEPREIVRLCAENALGYIEWGGDVHVPPGNPDAAYKVKKLCSDAGIVPVGYGSYYNAADDFEIFDAYLKNARTLGASYIRIWVGKSREYDPAAAGNIKKCVIAAENAGIKVSLECHRRTMTESAATALRLAEETGCLLHFQPNPDITFESNLEALRLTKKHLACCHVFAWEKGDRRLPLKVQADEWTKYAKAAGDVPFLLEFVKNDDPEQLAEDAKTLREILED